MPRRDGFVARLRDPAVLIHQAWRRLYILRHPDHPWLDPAAIRYLEGALDRSMIGLEWGSGRSTRWFASRLKHLTSVEHDSSWHERVRDALTRHGVSNV